MSRMDVSCFVGEWPFRKSRYGSFSDLQKVHRANGIGLGAVSSLQSVFWNDPMEAEEELCESLRNSGYLQVCTLNPCLPEPEERLCEAVERFGVRGVRLCPGYHGYRLDDRRLEPLYRALLRYGLPLTVTLRMEDYRLNYIVTPRALETAELALLADRMPDVRILFSSIQTGELFKLAELVNGRENIYADTACFKEPAGCVEAVLERIDDRKLLYGSAFPLYALKSTLCEVELARMPESSKRRILEENAANFFHCTPEG